MKKEKRDKKGIGLIGPMGLMGLMRPIRLMGLIGLIGLMGLMGCSSGGDAPETPPTPPTEPSTPTTPTTPTTTLDIPIVVCMSAASFEDAAEGRRAARRATAWDPPTGYHLYSGLYEDGTYVNLPNMGQSTIDLVMTHDDATTTTNPLYARLSYSSATEKWKLGLPQGVEPETVLSGDYYAYGFIPRDAAGGVELEKLRPADPECTWSEGAVLTIKDLKSVAVDPCIIIGAKHGFSPDYDGDYTDENGNKQYDDGTDTRTNRLRAGDFKFYLDTGKRTVDGKEVIKPNYLYFLFDHLYSAFSISMRVDANYDALRDIKLKGIYLQTEMKDGVQPSKADVTIRLESNRSGSNPIGSINFVYSQDPTTKHLIYSNSAGYLLTNEYSMFLGHFMPNSVSKLILTSKYDVYDTKGNLIRQDCEATNTLVLKDLFSNQEVSQRGWKYKVYMTIIPTYLYMLSDPDLNNPTVKVE